MWTQRIARFSRSYRDLHGFNTRVNFVAWGFRRAAQILLRDIADGLEMGRSPTDAVSSNVALAVGIERANLLGYVYGNKLKLAHGSAKTYINLVIPSITPGIIFGGYISFFNLASRLIARGYPVRFIVTETPMSHSKELVIEQVSGFPSVAYALRNADVVEAVQGHNYAPIPVSDKDIFVAYSAFTALLCHRAMTELNAGKFIYYIQEEEGHFHAHNSFRATIEYVYTLPHIPIYNSYMLEKYFKIAKLGVFADINTIQEYMTFRHALSTTRSPVLEEIAKRSTKKLLFFARPERHAERNLFEVGLVALRFCCIHGVFNLDEWEFHAIGAMTSGFSLELGGGHSLKFLKRVPIANYAELLYQYDLGVSLMYAPHPSVPNFEMAAAGMPTVTTTYINRSKIDMESVCPNFIAVEPNIEGVINGLKQAAVRVYDYQTRVKNSQFDWPRQWEDTFNELWLNNFDELIKRNFPAFAEVVFLDDGAS